MTSYSRVARAARDRQDALLALAAQERLRRSLRAEAPPQAQPAASRLARLSARLQGLRARRRQQAAPTTSAAPEHSA